MITCIFCGAQDPVHAKQLLHSFVVNLLQRQRDAGICEPVLNFMSCKLAAGAGTGDAGTGDAPGGEQPGDAPGGENAGDAPGTENPDADDSDADVAGNTNVNSCMCCFYWVTRRQKHKVVQMPMQTLLWFVRTLRWCLGSKCDSRILLRLVNTVTQPDNMYAHLFDASELLGMLAMQQQQAQAASKKQYYPNSHAVRPQQGVHTLSLKEHLAAIWHSNNGQSLLISSSGAADLLR